MAVARHRQRALRLVPGPAPLWHGAARGFGLGFERTLAYVTDLANVRDAIPFPRTPGNARY
jgi:aspartyl-tRNA synthetase